MLNRYHFPTCEHGDGIVWLDMEEDPGGEYVKLADVQALFTQEDVDLLRDIIPVSGGEDYDVEPDIGVALYALAAKIAALLPPA